MNTEPAFLQDRLELVRARITAAERRSGRAPGGVTLIGVVKTLSSETIAAAVELGLRDLGENRVQEAEVHQQRVGRTAATWHMIGHLQRNKVNKALAMFDAVHGVDDAPLGEALAQRAADAGRTLPVLVEVNVSGEGSKFGVAPDALPALLERLAALDGIELRGLMTVGAPVSTPAEAREGFAHLRALRDDGARRLGRPLPELSMGMSDDFEVAVEEGATLVRVGSAIFGGRVPQEGAMMAILGVVARLVGLAFDALMLVILVNALLSWIQPKPNNMLVRYLENISNAVCNPIRRVMPTIIAGLDLSPMIAMLLLMLLRGIIMRVLLG